MEEMAIWEAAEVAPAAAAEEVGVTVEVVEDEAATPSSGCWRLQRSAQPQVEKATMAKQDVAAPPLRCHCRADPSGVPANRRG